MDFIFYLLCVLIAIVIPRRVLLLLAYRSDTVGICPAIRTEVHCGFCQPQMRFHQIGIGLFMGLFAMQLSADIHNTDIQKVILFAFAVFLLMITLTDLWSGLIPDLLVYPVLFFFAGMRLVDGDFDCIFTGLLIGIGLLLIAWLTSALGAGDAKLMIVVGIVLGCPGAIVALILGSMLACIDILLQILCRQMDWREPFPFGPYLALGSLLTALWGGEIWAYYIVKILSRY